MSAPARPLSKQDFENLSDFRYHLRRFLRASEDLIHAKGITPLQYQLLLHVKGYAGREWATVGELAERLQAAPHGTAALITRCEEAGLVERRSSDTDARQVEVHLSRKGDHLVTLLAGLHQSELSAFRRAFKLPHLDQPVEPPAEQ
ncbi:MAG: helix-turn-helix domain-containing protein [Pseudomonadota bacterium]|uniref:MarR family winged helix-turn-helix transcriptional regulator n=1 Tax=Ralstonia pickettii TaxID=329 RepID=UPI002714DBF5|nr:helix-turn-helix domain-containing protein [Ralstonia pickettii]MEE2979166.1 helix-turn-helix domain-containing protein [Pseudomonadota bacterium]WKZ84439.1 MarR family transcriptional regulator [Ralstonia pickettii]